MSSEPTWRQWLEAHPYLEPMARLHHVLERAVGELPREALGTACRETGGPDCAVGVPLLQGADQPLDLAAAGDLLSALVERTAQAPLPPELRHDVRELRDLLRAEPAQRTRAIAWIVDGGDLALEAAKPAVLRLLGWTLLRRLLAPRIASFEGSPTREQWQRTYCPFCGAIPLLAQIVVEDGSSRRSLCCGLCGVRWAFSRIGCPFCGNTDPETLDVLEIDGEPRVRLDHCGDCRGYLKTYVGQGEETLFLSDWASLNLDLLAQERGPKRLGASLFVL
jgi:FdhE protein